MDPEDNSFKPLTIIGKVDPKVLTIFNWISSPRVSLQGPVRRHRGVPFGNLYVQEPGVDSESLTPTRQTSK